MIFSDGTEFVSNKKWDIKSWDFDSYSGKRTNSTLERMHHQQYFRIDRFNGEGVFFYAKTKKSKWELIRTTYKVKCTKVDRAF